MMTKPFWLILAAVLVWGLLHSFLASLKVKTLIRQWVGPEADRWYRIIYNLISIITLLPILTILIFLPDQLIYRIHYPWVLLTLAIQLSAGIILIVGVRQTGIFSFLGLRQVVYPVDDSPVHMVTTGLYKYVRHPLYSGGLVIIWLTPYMTWNLLAVNLGITIYILIGAYFEERKLEVEYGPKYVEYCHRTPMLIPGLHILFRKN
jgi:protein-S-isoprenylcysteine O-methyltransferase Ste14